MSKRRFIDIDEVYAKLTESISLDEGDNLFIPLRALKLAVAQATTLVVAEPERTNKDLQN